MLSAIVHAASGGIVPSPVMTPRALQLEPAMLNAFSRRPPPSSVNTAARPVGPVGSLPPPGRDRSGRPLWSAARVDFAEKLWGADWLMPGQQSIYEGLIRIIDIDPNMRTLDVGAALGGGPRLLAEKHRAWVTGYEPDPFLAELAMVRSRKAGYRKRAPVAVLDGASGPLVTRSVRAAIVPFSLSQTNHPTSLLRRVAGAIQEGGHLLLVEWTAAGRAARAVLENDMVTDPRPLALASADGWSALVTQVGFDRVVASDATDSARLAILAAMGEAKAVIESLPDKAEQRGLAMEMAFWAKRLAQFEKGLRVTRVHARRDGGQTVIQ